MAFGHQSGRRSAMTALSALAVAVALIVIWQAIVTIFQPPPFLLPDPARVFAALGARPDLWRVMRSRR